MDIKKWYEKTNRNGQYSILSAIFAGISCLFGFFCKSERNRKAWCMTGLMYSACVLLFGYASKCDEIADPILKAARKHGFDGKDFEKSQKSENKYYELFTKKLSKEPLE